MKPVPEVRSMKNTESSHMALIVLFIILFPFVSGFCLANDGYEQVFAGLLMLLPVLLSLLWKWKKGVRVQLKLTDLPVAAFLCYTLVRSATVPIDTLWYFEFLFCVLVYIAFRSIPNARGAILLAITIAGVIQALLGYLQLAGWMKSNNPSFPVTGSFANPGPYGGFLALAFIACLCLWLLEYGHWKSRGFVIKTLVLFFIGGMLACSDSRAAWISALAATVILLYGFRDRFTSKPGFKLGTIVKIMIPVILAGLLLGLYFYRPGSADVRLLIWRVSAGIFSDNMVLGHGVNSFPVLYMPRQAQFFTENPGSVFVAAANNHYQPFNLIILILCELGIVGLFLFLAAIGSVLIKDKDRLPVAALLVALLLFSCFSYVEDVLPLKIYYFLLAGWGAQTGISLVRIRKLKLPVTAGLVILSVICYFSIATFNRYNRAFALFSASPASVETKDSLLSVAAEDMCYNRSFMLRYGKSLCLAGNYAASLPVLTQITANLVSSDEILSDLAAACYLQGNVQKADSCFNLAFRMRPSKIGPLYKLFLLHKENDPERARYYAKRLLGFPKEPFHSVVLKARREAEMYLSLSGNGQNPD